MKHKTVFILGAGFSIDAGAPLQSNIVEEIFKLNSSKSYLFDQNKIEQFKLFLNETMYIQEDLHSSIPLEDIFTPLDRCIADNISFRNLDVVKVKEIREIVYYLIGLTLKELLTHNVEKEYINKFAKHLFDNCIDRKDLGYKNPDTDKVAVISTNWDILLDNSLNQLINNYIQQTQKKAVVDYCCHISSHDEHNHNIKPGLEILGQGGFNIKLLKLHGSYNWLQCPRCLRVYINFNEKLVVSQFKQKVKCRHCHSNFGTHDSHILISNLIMPTFLKDFSNPQYKLIWQNAGVELSEATKIVFIGYSLPQADFEMRQLLSRMIREDAEIEVVTRGPSNKKSTKELKERYEVFFGKRKPKFFYSGVKHYINNKLK
ncbi:hypothetical protein [Flavobacterium aquatile]|uniref:Deacetylase sirtuin-type domain-containing protein n=1 Tax=Flavobacterium aquatile LMG 4008 = ATCC 11947 TaxID=1453498 RepID=A0A095SXM5_9FLAO|nr:hypothetical protein [Flavobacterium aquatile]KGD69322.1 hypothetical protein LG45_00635 [Flavobacterium aquatile LMG 4008 = ATCC 11947]OXA66242.1 hypothetical protein B0A61_13240 [Flavobacterium aquatile LMG 4008 = ATCC 11947]